jgi:hypothetical protein
MRSCLVSASVGLLALACGPVWACGGGAMVCGPAVVAFPVFTLEGTRIGRVEARVRVVPALPASPGDGQPVPVIYARPGGAPGAVDPGTVPVPLPASRRSAVQGVVPEGY